MSVVSRVVIGGLDVGALIHVYRAWRSGRMPLMVGEADAKYWGKRLRFQRVTSLFGLAFFGALFIVGAIFA